MLELIAADHDAIAASIRHVAIKRGSESALEGSDPCVQMLRTLPTSANDSRLAALRSCGYMSNALYDLEAAEEALESAMKRGEDSNTPVNDQVRQLSILSIKPKPSDHVSCNHRTPCFRTRTVRNETLTR